MLSINEAEEYIRKEVIVTRHEIALAKAFLCRLPSDNEYEPSQLIEAFAGSLEFRLPQKVLVHPTADIESQLKQAVGYLKCYLAMAEAIWVLIYLGRFWSFGTSQVQEPDLSWTTVVPGSGGRSGSWHFPDFSVEMPRKIVVAPSYRHEQPQFLTDPDIFALEAGLDWADEEVVEAVQDAVTCFRHDLYRAAATMLGKAMEGAWIELGWTLVNALPDELSSKKRKLLEKIQDDTSLASKIKTVADLYATESSFDELRKRCGVRPNELNSTILWSNAVREARNAIHFGVRPAPPNTYEKVGILLIEGANSLGMLYQIKREANIIWPYLANFPIKEEHQLD